MAGVEGQADAETEGAAGQGQGWPWSEWVGMVMSASTNIDITTG